VEGVDQEAVGCHERPSVRDELPGEDVVGIMQRLWNGRTWDPVHAGHVNVANTMSGADGIEVGREVGFEREHRGRRGEEDEARDVELPCHGYGDGGQRDVRDESRRACAGEERAEEHGRGAAQRLVADVERIGARELGRRVERGKAEVQVQLPDGGEGSAERRDVAGLRGRNCGHRRDEGDVAAVAGGKRDGEAGERDQVAHAGAWEEDDMRRASWDMARGR